MEGTVKIKLDDFLELEKSHKESQQIIDSLKEINNHNIDDLVSFFHSLKETTILQEINKVFYQRRHYFEVGNTQFNFSFGDKQNSTISKILYKK